MTMKTCSENFEDITRLIQSYGAGGHAGTRAHGTRRAGISYSQNAGWWGGQSCLQPLFKRLARNCPLRSSPAPGRRARGNQSYSLLTGLSGGANHNCSRTARHPAGYGDGDLIQPSQPRGYSENCRRACRGITASKCRPGVADHRILAADLDCHRIRHRL